MQMIDAPAASELFLVRDFLGPRECTAVRAEARAAAGYTGPSTSSAPNSCPGER